VEALRRYVMTPGKGACRRYAAAGVGARKRQDEDGALMDLCARRSTGGRHGSAGSMVMYSPDREGEHPEQHLRTFRGSLQADAYAGFNQLYKGDGRIQQVACWAHVRRKFYDLQQAQASEALERIAPLYAVEKESRGLTTGRTATSSYRTIATFDRVPARMVRGFAAQALPQVGYDGGHSQDSIPRHIGVRS
jgi:transposase